MQPCESNDLVEHYLSAAGFKKKGKKSHAVPLPSLSTVSLSDRKIGFTYAIQCLKMATEWPLDYLLMKPGRTCLSCATE